MAVSLDRGIIAGLVRKEGAWSKISRALRARLLTQAPPIQDPGSAPAILSYILEFHVALVRDHFSQPQGVK